MKRILAIVILIGASLAAAAQTDVRGLWVFGNNNARATLEGWYTDKIGDSFFVSDFDFKAEPFSPSNAYLELARDFNFWKGVPVLRGFSLHAEFNGRLNMDNCNGLFGLSWSAPLEKDLFRATVSYKLFNGGASSVVPVQITLMWRLHDLCCIRGLEFRGLFMVWGETVKYWYGDENPLAAGTGYYIACAQPQLWYALGQFFGADQLSIGGQVDLGFNWMGKSGFSACPAAGVKWRF